MWWTLSAAILASGTALLIAFVAYPWQRQKDRAFKLSEERRNDYRLFIRSAYSMLLAYEQARSDIFEGQHAEGMSRLLDQRKKFNLEAHVLGLTAPPELSFEAMKLATVDGPMVIELRALIETGDTEALEAALENLISDMSFEFMKALIELTHLMRHVEFRDDGIVKILPEHS